MSSVSRDSFVKQFENNARSIISEKVNGLNTLITKYARFTNMKCQLSDLKLKLESKARAPSNATKEQLDNILAFLKRVVLNMSLKNVEKGFLKNEGIRYKLEQFDREPVCILGVYKKISVKELNSVKN